MTPELSTLDLITGPHLILAADRELGARAVRAAGAAGVPATASIARRRASGLAGSPARSMPVTRARIPAVSDSCRAAVVGSRSTSVTYLVLQVMHWTCSPVLVSGISGMKNTVTNRRPDRCRYSRSPPQRRQKNAPFPSVR